MKNLIILIIAVCSANLALAQDYKKSSRDAKKGLTSFNADQTKNYLDLAAAIAAVEEAVQYPEAENDAAIWALKGDIYNAVATSYKTSFQYETELPEDFPKVQNPGVVANAAYIKGLKMADKKSVSNAIMVSMRLAQDNMSNLGIFAYEIGNYTAAYENFVRVLQAHKELTERNGLSLLLMEEDVMNQEYITALAALNAGNNAVAKNFFMPLYEAKYDRPTIWESLYKIEAEKDIDAAYRYIEEGRALFPDDANLLFADINHSLKTNQLETLLGKLQAGIDAEPENVSLYVVTGSVYEQLYSQMAKEDGMEDKAEEYFNKAIQFYNQSIAMDPNFASPVYSIGALYFNKAAIMSQGLEELSQDYSREGLKKFDAFLEKVNAEFEKALPFFQQAESMDADDVNTLIALKEIYARKDNLELSEEFKRRLELVQDGGSNPSSYFAKQN
jgi:hypothetical protein